MAQATNFIAVKGQQRVALADEAAVGVHLKGKTAVKKTVCGRFAVVCATPIAEGVVRLIKLFSDEWHARRYNFAIHGDRLGD